MKYFYIFLYFALISCGVQQSKVPLKKETKFALGQDTVKFDEINYYKLDKYFDEFYLKNYHKSPKRKIIYNIVYGDTPKTVSDTLFVKDLEKYHFHQAHLEISKYQKIAEIYANGSIKYDVTCKVTFRDILVFKKNNKIVGISKICFGCDWETTFFNENRYYNLVSIDKFKELENLLNSN